jgi:hypothetical protein
MAMGLCMCACKVISAPNKNYQLEYIYPEGNGNDRFPLAISLLFVESSCHY